MTGVDFSMGADMQNGISFCFEHQTTVDQVVDSGWGIECYTEFSPAENLSDRLLNYCGQTLVPNGQAARTLAGLLLNSALLQSASQP